MWNFNFWLGLSTIRAFNCPRKAFSSLSFDFKFYSSSCSGPLWDFDPLLPRDYSEDATAIRFSFPSFIEFAKLCLAC